MPIILAADVAADVTRRTPISSNRMARLLTSAATALFFAVFTFGCKTSPQRGELRLNQIQVIGTHNSYHQRAPDSLVRLLANRSPARVEALDYSHRPLAEQLELQGVRQIELDCFADPEGGRYARPLGRKWAAEAGLPALPNTDPEGKLRRPGFKVMHVQDIDYFSSVLTLVDGLKQVRAWSRQHPEHVPVLILIELKAEQPAPELTRPAPIGERELNALEAEILSVFPREKILAPDDVRGKARSLPAALKRHGWPKLSSVRGKVMFALDNTDELTELYLKGHPALAERLMFVSVPPTHPAAAWMKENDPIEGFERIQELVRAGFMVRTRADSDTLEARQNDARRRDRALASGAQFVSTDFPEPNRKLSAYAVHFPNGVVARVNPVTGGPAQAWAEPEAAPPQQ
jgi:hypothetical protein